MSAMRCVSCGVKVRSVLSLGLLAALVQAGPAVAETPVFLPLLKLEYPGQPENIRMVYLSLAGAGDRDIGQPLLLDTGSSGMTVDCDVVLPADLCAPDGIRIEGETVIDGITVTTERVVAQYGTYDEHGQVARATLRLGGPGAEVATEDPVAFVIRTKKVRRSDGAIVGGPLWPKGLIGISPLGGIGPNQNILSPLAAVAVPEGLNRGYTIGDLGRDWTVCTIEGKDCPSVPALALGVDPEEAAGWKFAPLRRSDAGYNFPTVAGCLQVREETHCKPVLFDTGNSTVVVAGASGAPLPRGEAVTLLSMVRWDFATTYSPEVEFAPGLGHHIVGIRFFEENRLSIDLDRSRIGLRIGGSPP